ncbi:hypothetical protein EJD97_009402 [Solanum chilense]|uniref:Uncharacterized protein n=1 Tax=Solanum chilense TaxID=4083 RepID=A0A6N2AJ46_SOLCI|nr:hypothetical protein EJD97_009402 [Solanum chilense]
MARQVIVVALLFVAFVGLVSGATSPSTQLKKRKSHHLLLLPQTLPPQVTQLPHQLRHPLLALPLH